MKINLLLTIPLSVFLFSGTALLATPEHNIKVQGGGISAYVHKAESELSTIKMHIGAFALKAQERDKSEKNFESMKDLQRKLENCKNLLTALKKSNQENFDSNKGKFESSRDEVLGAFRKIQESKNK